MEIPRFSKTYGRRTLAVALALAPLARRALAPGRTRAIDQRWNSPFFGFNAKGTLDVAQPMVLPKRYFGSVTINPQTVGSSVNEISQHVLTHLQSLYGARVKISVEIEATFPDGFPAEIQQKIEKGSVDLRFEQSDFSDV